jgi:hypothetical protein
MFPDPDYEAYEEIERLKKRVTKLEGVLQEIMGMAIGANTVDFVRNTTRAADGIVFSRIELEVRLALDEEATS